jgi:hypothetical protein
MTVERTPERSTSRGGATAGRTPELVDSADGRAAMTVERPPERSVERTPQLSTVDCRLSTQK